MQTIFTAAELKENYQILLRLPFAEQARAC